MIQKSLKGLEIVEAFIISHVKVFLRNKYNSYINTARNAKLTSTGNAYEKTEKRFSEAYLEPTRTSIINFFLRKYLTGQRRYVVNVVD